MGVSIYVELENQYEFNIAGIDGKTLARACPDTDDGSLFAPLVQFISITEEQIDVVQNILQILRDVPPPDMTAYSQKEEFLSWLIIDMEVLERALQFAQKKQTRFHLAYDF